MATSMPGLAPLPLMVVTASATTEELATISTNLKSQRLITAGMESPVTKSIMSGTVGFGFGALLQLFTYGMAIEDPVSTEGKKFRQYAPEMFKELGRRMWTQGRTFGKIGAIYAFSEGVIEGFRAKHDVRNGAYAGGVTGAILARKAGPTAILWGSAGFAAFSTAIETYMLKEPSDED